MKVDAVKEYVKRISDEDLAFLSIRFRQKLYGDRAAVLKKLSEDSRIDQWLSSSTAAEELFDMVDFIGEQINQEYSRRVDEDSEKKYKKKKEYRKV